MYLCALANQPDTHGIKQDGIPRSNIVLLLENFAAMFQQSDVFRYCDSAVGNIHFGEGNQYQVLRRANRILYVLHVSLFT